MKIEFTATADPHGAGAEKRPSPRIPVFVVDYPKSGPVLESSFVFPKVESFGVWKICIPPGTEPVPTDG